MSEKFFGIDTGAVDLSSRKRTPLPLSKERQDDLIWAYRDWEDAGYIVHPAGIGGEKRPLSLPGYGSLGADGQRGYGWAAARDGDAPMLKLDHYADLVRSGETDGICILLPKDTRFAMLEVEAAARPLLPRIAEAAKSLGVYDVLGEMVHGYCEESTRGGLHFPFRVSGDVTVSKRKLATIQTPDGEKLGAEIIGAGGQFIAAPSCGRTSSNGLPYTLIYGSPSTVHAITPMQFEAICQAFSSIDTRSKKPAPASLRPAEPCDDAVKDFNRRKCWEEILVPHGWIKGGRTSWTPEPGRSLPIVYWRRPGKLEGHSATTCGSVMCCFSSNEEATKLPQFDSTASDDERAKTKRTKFQVYATLNHGGDTMKAMTAIKEMGFGKGGLSLLLDCASRKLMDGDLSFEDLKSLIPVVVSTDVLVLAANRERAALGLPQIVTPATKDDPRLRYGFNRIAFFAAMTLHDTRRAAFDHETRTLKRS
jgi:hypothetical protein